MGELEMKCEEDELFADADEEENASSSDYSSGSIDSEYSDIEDGFENSYNYDEVTNTVNLVQSRPNAGGGIKNKSLQPTSNYVQRFNQKINTSNIYAGLDSKVNTGINENERKLDKTRFRIKDKADRATVEQVIDPRTRVILAKMVNKHVFDELNGCISTGKEANVYHGTRGDAEVAVKIFKTSILVFKNREKYVTGDFRFKQGLCKNPRKMIRTWSEKEFRNLNRMYTEGLNVPQVHIWRSHVIVMDFIGKNARAAPRLKDVELQGEDWGKIYRDVVILMWKLHNKCKLVHADLSEFNMLYYNKQVFLIDVSQSLETSQRSAFNFLRKDMKNITTFFRKKNIPAMTIKDLFKFIVDANTNESNMEECLDILCEKYAGREFAQLTPEEEIEDNVIMEIAIVKTLSEIEDVEKEIKLAKSGLKTDLEYKRIVGLTQELRVANEPEILREKKLEMAKLSQENAEINDKLTEFSSGDDSDVCSSSDLDSVRSEDDQSKFVNSARPKHETTDEKKLRKKAIKENKAEKRKTKIKKHVKKAKVKNSVKK